MDLGFLAEEADFVDLVVDVFDAAGFFPLTILLLAAIFFLLDFLPDATVLLALAFATFAFPEDLVGFFFVGIMDSSL